MPRKIVWVGGPQGVGKTTVIGKVFPASIPRVHTGTIATQVERSLSASSKWRQLNYRQRTRIINDAVLSEIKKALAQSNQVVLDGHYSYRGKRLWYPESIRQLASIQDVEFLLVSLSAPQRKITLRIVRDAQKSRSQKASEILSDILLNKRFYEQYREMLSKKATTRGVFLWNQRVEETAGLLKGIVDDFVSERWKRSFLVPIKKV